MVVTGVVEFFGGGIATGGVVVCATGVSCLGGAPAMAVFGYDALDRLTFGWRENGASVRYDYAYDRLGNLTYQRGVGAYTYEAHRPQVLASAGGQLYGHDAVGNQTSRPGGVALVYNAFNLPTRVTQNGLERASFAYDGLGQRVRKTTDDGVDTYATDLYERRQRPDGSVRHIFRVRAGERPVAERTLEVAPSGALHSATRYLHLDRLGSPALVTDEAGAVVERRSYAPFGAARPRLGQRRAAARPRADRSRLHRPRRRRGAGPGAHEGAGL